jgi:hypothetical protein
MRATLHHFGPWQIPTHVTHALCSDGKRRYARITGQPDTYSTIPAHVKVRGFSVSGWIVADEDDYHFVASVQGKNYNMLPNKEKKLEYY